MTDSEWDAHWVKSIVVRLDGSGLGETSDSGEPIVDDDLLLLLNAHVDAVTFTLPESPHATDWEILVDTRCAQQPEEKHIAPGTKLDLAGRSLMLLLAPRQL